MNKKILLKLFLSVLIYGFLIFIIPIVFVNMIGYLFLGLARPIMFISKIVDLFIFIGISVFVNSIVIFIIWLVTRTIKKENTFIRPINGLEFKKENIIQIRKKKFGLMILATFELNNFKNIHYFFNSEDDLRSWAQENNLNELLVEKEYKFNTLKFVIKTSIFVLALGLVFRDSLTSNKTFRKGDVSSFFETIYSQYTFNEDYIVTNNSIYNQKTKEKINYKTSSTYQVDSEFFYSNHIYGIDLHSDYFVCKFASILLERDEPNSPNGSSYYHDGTVRYVEEEIYYNGKSKGIIKSIDTKDNEVEEMFECQEGIYFTGLDIQSYIYMTQKEQFYRQEIRDIYDYCYSKKGKKTCLNLSGCGTKIGDYYYFSNHVYKKRRDSRYIGLSGVYRYNTLTREIEIVKEFSGKKMIEFNDKYIIYLDYKTVYKYDLTNNTKTIIVRLQDYKNIACSIYNWNLIISCSNKDYYISSEGKLVTVIKN